MKNKLLNFKNWFQVKWDKTFILLKTDVSVLLSSISYFCLVIVIVKCYYDINNFDYLNNYLTESVNNNSSMWIFSTIDDPIYLENILNHLLKLEYCILSLSIIMLNIMLIRFLLRNYKELVKKILNIITFNKLDLDRIAYKILNYNLRFYNII